MAATIDNRVAELERANAQLRRQLDACSAELKEAREQQTATAEVLQVINSSPGDLAPVFDAMLENATRLCDGVNGILWTIDGKRAHLAASRNMPSAIVELLRRQGEAGEHPMVQRVIAGEHLFQFDLAEHDVYRSGEVAAAPHVVAAGVRTIIWVAMVKDGAAVGAFVISRNEIRPFTDKQIALLQNFAAQAVIAMENARLLTETREALEQQTATAEVLQVINSSPSDLAPIFDAILEKSQNLCNSNHGTLFLRDGTHFRPAAIRGVPEPIAERLREGLGVDAPVVRPLLAGEHFVHILDLAQLDHPLAELSSEAGVHALLSVPLRKGDELLGMIVTARFEAGAFSQNQIALLQNFAAQAVIAMENARLLTETREALEQQTATAEVLQVINSSPGDLAPVFDAMLEKATRLCEAPFGILRTWDGDRLHFGAVHGDPQFSDWVRQRGPVRPDSDRSPMGRILAGERVVSVADAPGDEDYRTSAGWREMVEASGVRSAIWVALHKDDALLGYITVYRQEVRPFTDKQIALLQNFAAQAVIAMENARLLTETREALEQQTATAEVLQVINSSPGDLVPVFDAMLERAMRLCGGSFGVFVTYEGEHYRVAANRGLPPGLAEFVRDPIPIEPGSMPERLRRGEDTIQIPNIAALGSEHRTPGLVAMIELGKARTALWVGLRKDGVPQGFFGIYRQEVRPFTDKQIALLQNFAAQAVIAMENARLLTETREALEQQTATAEVLQVINSSPGDLTPVFDAMLERAMHLCEAAFGVLWTFDGELGHAAAFRGVPPAFAEFLTRAPHREGAGTANSRLRRGEPVVQIADISDDDAYRSGEPVRRALVELGGGRTMLAVPLRKDDAFLGSFVIYRQEVRPFSDKQIALLQNFAAQAVIAMENARLITETREALEQQTATAEVLQVINSSPGDLAPVFDAMIRKAVWLCGAVQGSLRTFDGEALHLAAWHGDPSFAERARELGPIVLRPGHPMEPLLRGQRIVHLTDAREATANSEDSAVRERVAAGNIRSWLAVALRTDGGLLGSIAVSRQEVRPFTDKQIALLENFAAQAVIAMENARLLTETREALEQQTATAEVLQVINSSPGDLAPVFDAILGKAHSLCGADFGSLFLYDGESFRAIASRGVPETLSGRLRDGIRANESLGSQQLIAGEPFYHIHDTALEERPSARIMDVVSSHRTLLGVPLRKGDALLGMIVAGRFEVRPFTDKQIALWQNFAAQAVIAMENARLLTETREALEQQTATAEVLQVINSSPGDLAPVFDAMLERAMRLCEAAFGDLGIFDGEQYRWVAAHGIPDFAEYSFQLRPEGNSPLEQLTRGERLIHLADVRQSDAYRDFPAFRSNMDRRAVRSLLVVPLRKDGGLLGAIRAYRQEPRPFTDKQIALLENFAAQAVIAMENARLLTETREALEQQTATAEVLQVINSSPGDLAPVFDAMLEKALRLCEASFGVLCTYDETSFRAVALRGVPAAYAEFLTAGPLRPGPGNGLTRVAAGEKVVHVVDLAAEDVYRSGETLRRALVDLGGARSALTVALLKDELLLGAFIIYRGEVRAFTDKQIALLQNFAAQAVIAMENARLLTETREALEQQTATAEVLQVINSSPGDLAPVFDAMLEKATRLCEASFGILRTWDGERFHSGAVHGEPWFGDWVRRRGPFRPDRNDSLLGRIIEGEGIVSFADARDEETYRTSTGFREVVEAGGIRSGITVPLRKDQVLLGAIIVYRQEVRPFSDKQVTLLQNFAAQAVIAMENARLLTETREALEQQTATAEVLQVINSSPGDLAPVFDAMLDRALRLCNAAYGNLLSYDGDRLHPVAVRGDPRLTDWLPRHGSFRPGPGTTNFRIIRGEVIVHVADAIDDEPYRQGDPIRRALVEIGQCRALLSVALRKDDALLGVIHVYRTEPHPFSDKQIALLQNFAAQAVIAMENARLLGELRQRTSDLEESLEYQTATSDVLRVISGSVFDLEPVLQTVLSRATDLCRSPVAEIFRLHDGGYRWAAGLGVEPEYEEIERRSVIQPGQDTLVGRVALERRMVHVADVLEDPLYGPKQEARLGKFRTMLGVPLLRDDMVIGVIAIARWIVEPYTDKEIRLVTTFADQAVIAIENARLLGELRERTAELGRSVEELKMLSEVGRSVSSTLDLRAVLSTILTASLGMTWATAGAIFRYIRAERAFRLVEAVGWDEALLGSVGDLSIAETETLMSEAALSRTPIQLTDLAALPSTPLRDASLAAGLRSVLIVPLVGPERIFGALVLQRREAGEFPPETVRLMQTLASQSVLAIQNARLFREIADKSEQLALASEHKSQFLANMSHELRTPLNAILGYAELLVDGIYGVLPEKAQGVLERVQNNGKHLLALINDVLDLAKIEAGQLALTLEDYALAEVVRGVVTATEPLAVAKGLKFTAIVQDGMPMAHGDARRVSQVLLNLAGNAVKFTDAGEVEINASAANGQFLLTVRDTGPGIADADQERIFGEFQQIENDDTRKKGGTGLGLAISKRMVEMQGGMISVESTLGRGSTFRVVLPVRVEPAMEEAAE